jgi:hypothetical protein
MRAEACPRVVAYVATYLNVQSGLFFNFPAQRLLGAFARLEIAAGEFPAPNIRTNRE